jgi:ethanolamine ammonia-lyase small subunit
MTMAADLRNQVRDIVRQVLAERKLLNSPETTETSKAGIRVHDYLNRANPYAANSKSSQDFSPVQVADGGVREASNVHTWSDPDLLRRLQETTSARIGVWRAGPRPTTDTLLSFREDHAAAVDAVFGEIDQSLLQEFDLFVVETLTQDKHTYIRRPDLGRRLSPAAVELLKSRCVARPEVQIVVSDGLSAAAIMANLRDVYPSLRQSLQQHGLKVGTPFYVSRGRVAVMDHIGEVLQPDVICLLIGERPGLVAADSMSAYLCYQPRFGTVEADRMVVSNIHRKGTPPAVSNCSPWTERRERHAADTCAGKGLGNAGYCQCR